LLVGDTSGTNKDHAVSGVVGLDVVLEIGTLDALDVLLGSKDGASEGLALESGCVKVVKNNFLELLVNLLLFAEDDITLALDGLGLELGVLENVGENVNSGGDVVVEGLGVVDGVFALSYPSIPMPHESIIQRAHIPMCRRSSVHPCSQSRAPIAVVCASQFPAICISLHRHLLPVPCPYLEGKVLEEVRSSVRPVRLCAATSIDPYTDGRGLGPRGVLGSDLRHRVNCCPDSSASVQHTVKPFLRVVDSVFAPYVTGVASPRVKGDAFEALTALMAARERMPCCRLSASRREAIASARRAGEDGGCGGDGGGMGYVELQLGYVGVDEVRNLPSRDVPGPAANQ
jgi:hypothetical protein